MLTELYVRNFALISELDVEFRDGLNVLTGETGAGKSIVVDCLSLLTGARARQESIRIGSDQAVVEGTFRVGSDVAARLEEMGHPPEDGVLILSRQISRKGSNRCRINGVTVQLNVLAQVGALLLEIHGQHDNQRLLREDAHLDLLDRFGGETLLGIRSQMEEAWRRLDSARKERRRLVDAARERARQIELLQYQIDEIDEAALTPGEDAELDREATRLAHAEQIAEAVSVCRARLVEGGDDGKSSAVDALGEAIRSVAAVSDLVPELDDRRAALEALAAEVQEVSRQLRLYEDEVQADPDRLQAVEERLDLIATLKRKYGPSIDDILAFRRQIEAELADWTDQETRLERIDGELEAAELAAGEVAGRLYECRRHAAEQLEGKVEEALRLLNMAGTRLSVDLRRTPNDDGVPISGDGRYAAGPAGTERARFLLATNEGEGVHPLSRIASGGELSRVMLAFKSILAAYDDVPTLVFDEVDAGIGGLTANAVARTLRRLGAERQLFCVTHLAQIAAAGDAHITIEKEGRDGRTVTNVELLAEDRRVYELARMLGDTTAETSLEHARQMLLLAKEERRAG